MIQKDECIKDKLSKGGFPGGLISDMTLFSAMTDGQYMIHL